MASNITLSAGVRQNLLSLQNTAALAGLTQGRLATGKKVNSALDNPANFFTSQSLSNRASDLNDLLDSIGQAQKNLEAADKGLTSLTTLVQSAKSIAKQARQAAAPTTTYGAIGTGGTAQSESKGTFTASAFAAPGSAGTLAFTVSVNGTNYNLTTASIGTSDTVAQVQTKIQAAIDGNANTIGHVTANLDGTSTYLKIDANDVNTDVKVTASAVAQSIGLTTGAVSPTNDRSINSVNLMDNIVTAGGTAGTSTLQVNANGAGNQTVTFGYGVGQVHDLSGLNTALAALSGVTASATGTGNHTVAFAVASSSSANSLVLAGSTGVDTGLGITSNTYNGVAVTSGPDATRTSLQADYNSVLTQIDALAKDASYNGINLLNGDNLKVVFNETGTSSQTINGVTYDSGGLGLSQVSGTGFQQNTTVDSTITAIDTALSALRTQASKFGSNLTTVQTRQDFTKALVNTLQTGADNLVLADTNQEGANLLALQTRQQLSSTALSLSAQADQAVLRLFG